MNLDLLKKTLNVHEDRRSHPYKDSVGKTSIGVGRNLDDNGLSEDEIEFLLNNDIRTARREADTYPWFVLIDNDVRRNVVIEMIFNLGLPRFDGFRKTIAAIKNRDWNKAAKEMLDSKWADQVGYRAQVLSEMMRTGKPPSGAEYK